MAVWMWAARMCLQNPLGADGSLPDSQLHQSLQEHSAGSSLTAYSSAEFRCDFTHQSAVPFWAVTLWTALFDTM